MGGAAGVLSGGGAQNTAQPTHKLRIQDQGLKMNSRTNCKLGHMKGHLLSVST